MAETLSKRERVQATVRGSPVDRPAYGFWRHFHEAEYSLDRHVASMLWWQEQVQNDFLKVQPRASFMVEDWGVVFRYPTSGVVVGAGRLAPAEKGSVSFAPVSPLHEGPVRLDYPVKSVQDWQKIRVQVPDAGAKGERLRALRMVRDGVGDDVRILETLFTPLAIAARLTGSDDEMVEYLRRSPSAVHQALDVITQTYVQYVRACLQAGASGIFLATTQWASRDRLTEGEYAEFGRPYDLRVLEAARDADFNMLHVCGNNNMLLSVSDYPVHSFNWAAYGPGNPSLTEARAKIPNKVLVGGVSLTSLAEATPDRAVAEARAAQKAAGARWMASADCSVRTHSPVENVRAVGRGLGEAAATLSR